MNPRHESPFNEALWDYSGPTPGKPALQPAFCPDRVGLGQAARLPGLWPCPSVRVAAAGQ